MYRHGRRNTPEYWVWRSMKLRCLVPTHHNFSLYGGRGISICKEWVDSFMAFFAHIGPRPTSEHSLDRIDNERGYEPGNVRWATAKEQARNRRSSRILDHNGLSLTLTEWAERIGISVQALWGRLKKGWQLKDALTREKKNGQDYK